MGGYPKGLLPDPASGRPLVQRLCALAQQAGLDCLLVGQRAEYLALGLPMLADRPAGIGPLGGLSALLHAAREKDRDGVVALSCDLPYLSPALLSRLLLPAAELADCDVLAPQRQGRFEPLCARYQPTVLPVLRQALDAEERSFQKLLRRLRVRALSLSPAEAHELDDWDEPKDLAPRP